MKLSDELVGKVKVKLDIGVPTHEREVWHSRFRR
jgi:hypothetical protein